MNTMYQDKNSTIIGTILGYHQIMVGKQATFYYSLIAINRLILPSFEMTRQYPAKQWI